MDCNTQGAMKPSDPGVGPSRCWLSLAIVWVAHIGTRLSFPFEKNPIMLRCLDHLGYWRAT